MIKRKDELITRSISSLDDIGNFTFTSFFTEKELPSGMNELGIMEIPAGEECGMHSHSGESDIYYIISGEGVYVDNDNKSSKVHSGDITCCYGGESHALINKGNTPLVVVAIIPKSLPTK